ncbi:unnamed protein product [Penicillium salamii]|uniref:NCT transcriptional regulatory complex subunit B n=1 Tax=Penicillium salamii TaxID=1612424 RepID=A0A9W4JDL6_9EURO|nr:unnamed protein product [Penicillium salamii]
MLGYPVDCGVFVGVALCVHWQLFTSHTRIWRLTNRLTATVQKIITEILPPSSGQTFSKDARDLLMECCVEFITLISSEANDISEKEAKKTIACEHVEKALRDLGFSDYIADVLAVAEEHKQQLKSREKKQSKMEQSGLTEEELLRQQQELFRSATDKYNSVPE